MKHCVYLLIVCLSCVLVLANESLYDILGVRKSASAQDIKKAYKKLAREWHPDKNDDPGANERFMKINEAYETLSDADRRQDYDNFGTTTAQANSRGGQGHGSPFDDFFRDGPFGFSFNFDGRGGGGGRESSVGKYAVTLRAYDSKIFPESYERPYLLYTYTDFCYRCMQVDLIWDKIARDMETIGMGAGTVHAQFERPLVNRLRISSVPYMVVVINGRLKHYSADIRVQPIRDFIRLQLPTDLITEVSNSNYEEFLEGWTDNRVRMLFFGDRQSATLRYMLAAFTYRERVNAGYVNVLSTDSSEILKKFNIQRRMESLLVFNEDTLSPAAHVSMKQLSRSTMDEVIEANKYLLLPRLSSHRVFNSLCPGFSSLRKKSLCVILLSRNTPEHDTYRSHFRQYAQEHPDSEGRVRYTYVYEDTQATFVKALTRGQGAMNETMGTLKVAIMWRKNSNRLLYDWLEDGWHRWSSPEAQRSRRKLHQMVDWILQSGDILPYAVEITTDLNDEHAQALIYRIVQRLFDWWDLGWDKLMHMEETTVVTLVMTVTFVIVIGAVMKTLVTMDEAQYPQSKKKKKSKPPQSQQNVLARPTVYLHPLCVDNFETLISQSEAGVRLIVVLVHSESRDKLLQDFAEVVHPYARSDAFKFAFLQLESYLSWYRHLLEETLDFKRDLGNINIQNCIGTVLAINGPRKYYSIYHAESERARRMRKTEVKDTDKAGTGDFMGFDDSDSESDLDSDAEKLFMSDLLGSLGIWMDRLCEGSLKRFRVEYWPSMSS